MATSRPAPVTAPVAGVSSKGLTTSRMSWVTPGKVPAGKPATICTGVRASTWGTAKVAVSPLYDVSQGLWLS